MFLINRIRKQYLIWNGGARIALSVLWLDYGMDSRIIGIRFPGGHEIFSVHSIQPLLGSAKPPMKQVPDRDHPRGVKRPRLETNKSQVEPRCIINCRDVTFTL